MVYSERLDAELTAGSGLSGLLCTKQLKFLDHFRVPYDVVPERDGLRLLGTGLGGPAIARELMVSLNTVRTHTKHIYAKLAVTNRRAAVRRARELDLLSRS